MVVQSVLMGPDSKDFIASSIQYMFVRMWEIVYISYMCEVVTGWTHVQL